MSDDNTMFRVGMKVEVFHDASFDKERAQQLFLSGVLSLRERAMAESIFFAIINRDCYHKLV